MQEMNPYYARQSSVGPVFDVGTWNTRFAVMSVLMGLGMFVVLSIAAYAFYDPTLLAKFDAKMWRELQREILGIWKDYPLGSQIGLGAAIFFAYIGLAASVSTLFDSFDPDFYLRVGAGGMSLRVPDGVDLLKLGFVSRILKLDLPWHEIKEWKVTQTKQFGAMSPHAGNISADLTIRLMSGKKHVVNLDHFQENGHVIWKRIGDASELTAAELQAGPNVSDEHSAPTGPVESRTAIEAVLTKNLYAGESSVVLSDADTGRIVQFAVGGGKILLDLPCQTLDESATQRAAEYFAAQGEQLRESELLDRPGGVAVGIQQSYQLELGSDVECAIDAAMNIFTQVYQLPPDFPLDIEEV